MTRQLKANYTACPSSGIEDVEVAICLRKVDVYPEASTDELGRERFHPMDIRSTYELTPNMEWLFSYAANPPKLVFKKFIFRAFLSLTELKDFVQKIKKNCCDLLIFLDLKLDADDLDQIKMKLSLVF
jgi:hypothetical protein